MYESRAYDNDTFDGFGPVPVVVLVVTGNHDVSRLLHLLNGGQALCEQLDVGQRLARQVARHNGGREAMKLLAQHGGPDLLERLDLNPQGKEPTGMQFIALTEANEHEGETWRYWLQLTGNEDAIEQLRAAIAGANEEETYDLDPVDLAVPESEVDVLVKHSMCGYTTLENKVAGVLTLPDDFDTDVLYKGGVGSLYTEPDAA